MELTDHDNLAYSEHHLSVPVLCPAETKQVRILQLLSRFSQKREVDAAGVEDRRDLDAYQTTSPSYSLHSRRGEHCDSSSLQLSLTVFSIRWTRPWICT